MVLVTVERGTGIPPTLTVGSLLLLLLLLILLGPGAAGAGAPVLIELLLRDVANMSFCADGVGLRPKVILIFLGCCSLIGWLVPAPALSNQGIALLPFVAAAIVPIGVVVLLFSFNDIIGLGCGSLVLDLRALEVALAGILLIVGDGDALIPEGILEALEALETLGAFGAFGRTLAAPATGAELLLLLVLPSPPAGVSSAFRRE